MKIGVLGTGMVGQALASRLVETGHQVALGAREAGNPRAARWAGTTGGVAGTFADAARHGDMVINATAGPASLAALAAAGGAGVLAGKVLVDVANPLDVTGGDVRLSVANTDSLGEQIQRAYPESRVVKALNTVTAEVMVHPDRVPGAHHTFLAGDDPQAKWAVEELLSGFGWGEEQILDLGGIRAARGMEMYLPLWLSLVSAQDSMLFNIQVRRA